jgi:hypothetical protein
MHPVNTDDFGLAGMLITYSVDGASTVSGHIVKQVGQTKYLVAPGAVGAAAKATFHKVRLARTAAEVANLPAGVGSILVSPVGGNEHARKIFYRKLLTVEGHTYYWRKTTADQPGECNVAGNWFTGPDVNGFQHEVNV